MRLENWINKDIPIMGFGGIPIMSGKDSDFLVKLKNVDYDESIEVVKQAIKKGIRFFDTALDYGDSEIKIGIATRECRENVVIATKSKALTYNDMMYAVEKSLKRLDTEYIDLYQLHFVKDSYSYQTIMGKNGAYSALVNLQEQGIIKKIGIASHNKEVLSTALHDQCFYSVQLPYNVIEQENIDIIISAKSKGIKTIIMKPFAGGTLTKIHPKIAHIVDSENTIKKLALLFVLKECVDMVIPGISSIEELEENYTIINNYQQITKIDSKKIESISKMIGTTFCRRCQYCEPCPQGIEIAKILRFEKYYEDYNLKEWAKKQYDELEIKVDSCKKCYLCESRCPYNLNITQRLEEFKNKMEKYNV